MGNKCCLMCLPCLPCVKEKYNNYDYFCQNKKCQKRLEPDQELFILPSKDLEDYIYCSEACSNECSWKQSLEDSILSEISNNEDSN